MPFSLVALIGAVGIALWIAWRVGRTPEEDRLSVIGDLILRGLMFYLIYGVLAGILFLILMLGSVGLDRF